MLQLTYPIAVAADSRLSDDVLLTAPLSIDPDALAGASIAASGDGILYLFGILSGQGAVEIQQTAAGASGYEVVPLPAGQGASEIAAMVDDSATIHAFYVTVSGLVHTSRAAGEAWASPDNPLASLSTSVSGLATTQVPLTGEWVITGTTSDGNLLICNESDGAWTAAKVDVNEALLGGTARVQYTSSSAWVLFAAGTGQGSLQVWTGDGTAIASGPQGVSVANPAAKVHFTHLYASSALSIFTETEHNLYSMAGFSDQPQPIAQSQIVQGTGRVDSQGNIHFYGADPNGSLWVLRQTGWDDDGMPAWAPIFPLDLDVTYIGAPALAGGSPNLVAIRADGSLDLLGQQVESGLWCRTPVQGPATMDALKTTRYRTRLSLTDANGLRCAGAALTITPSALVALEVAGQTVIASPSQPAVLVADMAGAIELSQPATGLDSVSFTVTGDGIGSTLPPVVPHDYLYAQLGGTSSIFTGSATIPPMSAGTLVNATSGGKPLAPGLTSDNAATAAQAIQSAIEILNGTSNAAGYELDLRDPAAPRFVRFETVGELRARLETRAVEADGSVWDEIGQFFGDVWNAIRTGAMQIVSWVIDAANQVISLTVQVAEGIYADLKNLAILGAGEIVSLVHGIFSWLGAEAATVLNWLKDQLGWTNIWNNMVLINRYLTSGLQALDNILEQQAVIATGTFFQDLKSGVDAQFAAAIQGLAGQALSPSTQTPGASRAAAQPAGSEAQNNWLQSKLMTYLPGSNCFADPGITTDVLTQIQAAIASSGLESDLQDALAGVKKFFADLIKIRKTWDVLLTDLLKVVQSLTDVVLDAADSLVTALLELVADAIGAVDKVLTTPLPDIPLLTWLWENVLMPAGSSEPMTLGKLICLLLAVPVTLAEEVGGSRLMAVAGRPPYRRASSSSAQDSMQTAQFYGSLALVVVDAINDILNGTATDDGAVSTLVWNWVDFGANAAVCILYWPEAEPLAWNWDWSKMTYGTKIATGTALGYLAAVCIDGLFTAIETTCKIASVPYPAFANTANVVIDLVNSVLLLGVGVCGAVEEMQDDPPNADWNDVVEAILNPLPWLTQFLVTQEVVEASGGVSIALQCVVDAVGDGPL